VDPRGAIGVALEVVAVDVVEDRTWDAAGGGVGADVWWIRRAVAAAEDC
jgi:hypothetical protein